MSGPRQNKALKLFISTILLIGLIAFYGGEFEKSAPTTSGQENTPEKQIIEKSFSLSKRAKTHILYGDQSGGGHMHGIGKPCKSEFPKDWDENEIVETVEKIAANDNLNWRQQDNGYYITNKNENGLKIRVVLNPDKTEVITAYPLNVKRNPCPGAANDNNTP